LTRFNVERRAARTWRAAPLLSLTLVVLGILPAPALGQGARGTATTTVRYISLRPIALDTVPRSETVDVDGVPTFEGQPVTCLADGSTCVLYRPLDVAHGVVATQDVSATAWGLGLEGLSATLLVRGRADLDGDFVWPRSDDHFDAVLAYAQLQRSHYRIRAGRQRTLSGLGFSGFDGLDIAVDPLDWLRAEAYGGRSLARGLSEPRNEALRGIEDFILDQDAYLFGGFVSLRPRPGTEVGVRYQREIFADRIGLVSERGSVDLRSDLGGPVRLDAAVDYDFAFARLGKAHLTLRSALPGDWGLVEVTGRRYLPYFELSTIWGFFSPAAYHEVEARATVVRWAPLTAWASAGWRKYGDPEIAVFGPSITDESQRYSVGGRLQAGSVTAFGEYRIETGFGAYLSSGDVEVRWTPVRRLTLLARGAAFQQIAQFRIGEQVVLGGGLGLDARLPAGLRLRAGADLYRQAYENRPSQADWDQLRAYSILSIPFGEDPGMRGRP
jgi:hypothetical protein